MPGASLRRSFGDFAARGGERSPFLRPGLLAAVLWLFAAAFPEASELVRGEYRSDLVPGPTPYAAILPEGYRNGPPLPVVIWLHGAGQTRDQLVEKKSLLDAEWTAGRLPKMIVAMPSAAPWGFYMDFKDGSQKWETLLGGPFRRFVQGRFNGSADPKKNLLIGGSMGGEGSLRIAFRHPERLAAVAALEPAVQPVGRWSEVTPKMRYWISDDQYLAVYGRPFDADYWEKNTPAFIATERRSEIAASGLQIYLDVGDDDTLFLYDAAEYLHRTLWDIGLKHEYHLVHGGDHVGRSLARREAEALEFLARALGPSKPDPAVAAFRAMMAPARQRAELP